MADREPQASVPAKTTGGLSMAPFRNQMNPTQDTTVFRNANPVSNPNSVYLKESKWAYMGTQRDKGGKTQDVFMDVSGADVSYYFLSNQAKATLRQQMDAMYGKGVWQESWIAKAYRRGLEASAYAYANMGTRVTALDATAQLLSDDAANGLAPDGSEMGAGGKGYTGPVTTVQQTRSVNLTDPMSARKLVDDALEGYLGRRATSKEQETFLQSLNQRERQAPSVTTQRAISTPRGPGMTTVESEVLSEGGFNPTVFAEEFARGQQGSAEFQAATTYMDAFIDSLRARV